MSGYHLYSDNYKNAIIQGISTLQHEEEFVDLTLAADGHLVRVHKNIVAVASPYIKALLKSAPCSSPVIFLNNVRHVILQYILSYIYQGEVDVPKELFEEFVQVGKALHINGIHSIPKQTSVVVPETTVVKKPESSKNVAAHIRIDNLNKKHSLEVLQLNQNDSSTTSLVPVVEQLNQNVIQIHYGNETRPGFQTNNNFVTGNNLETGSGNNFAIDYDFGTGNENITANNPQIRSNIEIRNDPATGNNIVTVINPSTDNDNGNSNNFAIDLGTANPIATVNDYEAGNDIMTDNNLQTGNDIVPGNDLHTETDTDPKTECHYENVSHTNENTEEVFDYEIQLQRLDPDSVTAKSVSDVNTELNKIDANDLKGMAQYSLTERGSIQLILNRFIYCCQFESRRGHRRRWRCIDYRRSHCPAFVETEDGLIVKRKGIHCHPFHDTKIYNKHKKGLIYSSEDNVKNYMSNTKK